MKDTQTGWVVIDNDIPTNSVYFIMNYTFSRTRKGAIQKFIDGSGETWLNYKRKYGFRVVKASQTISVFI